MDGTLFVLGYAPFSRSLLLCRDNALNALFKTEPPTFDRLLLVVKILERDGMDSEVRFSPL